MMKWFGFGKKKNLEQASRSCPQDESPESGQLPRKSRGEEIIVEHHKKGDISLSWRSDQE